MILNLGWVPKRVLDIGANVGLWSRWAQLQWPEAKILAIEANPGCRSMLKKTGVEFHIALLGSTEKASVPFYTLDSTATGASVYRELTGLYDGVRPQGLQQTTLDRLVHECGHKPFDFIKLDTQGSELDILAGGTKTLEHAAAVLMEISIQPYNEGAPYGDEVFARMRDHGFRYAKKVSFAEGIQQGDWLFTR